MKGIGNAHRSRKCCALRPGPKAHFQNVLSTPAHLEETLNCWQSCRNLFEAVGSILKANNHQKNDIWAATIRIGYSLKAQFTQNCWIFTRLDFGREPNNFGKNVLIHTCSVSPAVRPCCPAVPRVQHLLNQWAVHNCIHTADWSCCSAHRCPRAAQTGCQNLKT